MNSKALHARLPSSGLSIQRIGLIVISIPVVALVVCAGLFGYAQQEDSVAHGWLKHTLKVQERIPRIVRTALDIQSFLRSYIATGDDRSLNHYRDARPAIPGLLDGLATLVAEDAGQGERAKRIKVLTDGTLAQIDRLLPVLQAVHREESRTPAGPVRPGRTQK